KIQITNKSQSAMTKRQTRGPTIWRSEHTNLLTRCGNSFGSCPNYFELRGRKAGRSRLGLHRGQLHRGERGARKKGFRHAYEDMPQGIHGEPLLASIVGYWGGPGFGTGARKVDPGEHRAIEDFFVHHHKVGMISLASRVRCAPVV